MNDLHFEALLRDLGSSRNRRDMLKSVIVSVGAASGLRPLAAQGRCDDDPRSGNSCVPKPESPDEPGLCASSTCDECSPCDSRTGECVPIVCGDYELCLNGSCRYEPPDDAYTIIALGDSVMWGQGLALENKFVSRVAADLQANLGRNVAYFNFAHSGATLLPRGNSGGICNLVPDGSDPWVYEPLKSRPPAEVPLSSPSILAQVIEATYRVSSTKVDLVLLDGGANDTNLTPFGLLDSDFDPGEVQSTGLVCGIQAMDLILQIVLESFPNATVVLTGYYPPISELSASNDLDWIVETYSLLETLGSTDEFLDRSTARARAFASIFDQGFALLASSHAERVVFARNDIYGGPRSLMGEEAMLWGVFDDDEVKDQRIADCATFVPDGFGQFKCDIAATAHPNIEGAFSYYAGIMRALGRHFAAPMMNERRCQQLEISRSDTVAAIDMAWSEINALWDKGRIVDLQDISLRKHDSMLLYRTMTAIDAEIASLCCHCWTS